MNYLKRNWPILMNTYGENPPDEEINRTQEIIKKFNERTDKN